MSLFEFDQELHERTMKEIYTEEGRREGEIYTMFKRMHMSADEISKELGLDVEYVKDVIETI